MLNEGVFPALIPYIIIEHDLFNNKELKPKTAPCIRCDIRHVNIRYDIMLYCYVIRYVDIDMHPPKSLVQ